MFDLEEELKKLPAGSGVYLMHDDKDKIVYMGKAISLRNRVRQYFQSDRNKTAKIEQVVSHVAQFEYILTDSELEALVLGCNLIKEHRPWYNTVLKNDKGYPYIKATMGGDFPRLLLARDIRKDGRSRYFGPHTSVGAVKDMLDLIHKLYRIRTYSRNLPEDTGKERSCLSYHIKQRSAPCQGYVSRKEYQPNFNQALDFLNGRYDPLIKSLQERTQTASDSLEFGRAIEYQELLNGVKQVTRKQKMTSSGMEDRDIVAMVRGERDAVVQILLIRGSKLIGRDHFHISAATTESEGEVLDNSVRQSYASTPFISRELWPRHPLGDEEVINQWLSAKRRQKIRLVVPKKEERERLVELATRSAALMLSQDKERIKEEELRTTGAMNQIRRPVNIGGIRRVEAHDISNTSGVESVDPMVVYEDGRPKRSGYRKFRVKTVRSPSDHASMEEVLTRRLSHSMRETEELEGRGANLNLGSFTKFPDLTMMDDGRGQANIALGVPDKLGLSIPVYGMVKDDNHKTRGLYYNNVEMPIGRHSEGSRLIIRVQDETYRSTIGYHRSLGGRDQVRSILNDIPGVKPARGKALMRHFKDIEAVRSTSMEDLEQTPQMNRKSAESVYRYFHPWSDGIETGAVTNSDDRIEVASQNLETQ